LHRGAARRRKGAEARAPVARQVHVRDGAEGAEEVAQPLLRAAPRARAQQQQQGRQQKSAEKGFCTRCHARAGARSRARAGRAQVAAGVVEAELARRHGCHAAPEGARAAGVCARLFFSFFVPFPHGRSRRATSLPPPRPPLGGAAGAHAPTMEAVEASVPSSSGGTLAARIFYPRTLDVPRTAPDLPATVATAARGACALVVHQYSVMGGSQDLMRGIAREFATRHSVVAVTFNLRGVGGSSGCCTLTGHGEADDVTDVGRWLEKEGFNRILLVCSSAGAPIGGSALDRVPAFTACVRAALRVRVCACACVPCVRCVLRCAARARARRANGGLHRGALTHASPVAVVCLHCVCHTPTCSYVALGYVFGFWASILFGGHYKAVLESTKPKLFVQARAREHTHTCRERSGAVSSSHVLTRLLPSRRRRCQGSKDEFTYPSTLLEARARSASA
jgi:alpha/beta superfamily hydrolase